jgi:hypothetical protein
MPVKILAATINCGWLIVVIVMLFKEPPKATDISFLVVISLIFVTLILNLAALFWRGKTHDWLSLFLQRKALEEKKKMESLNSKNRNGISTTNQSPTT